MDGLIIVLAIIGFIIRANKKKKKQAQQGGAARPAPAQPQKPEKTLDRWLEEAMDEIDGDLDGLKRGTDPIQAAITKAAQSKPKAKPDPQPAKPKPQPRQVDDLAEAAARRAKIEAEKAAHAAARIPCHEHEGLHATQGETQTEHAEHMRRIREAEEAERSAREAAQALRSLNLQKLRSAVVMSEILDKPVALRRSRR